MSDGSIDYGKLEYPEGFNIAVYLTMLGERGGVAVEERIEQQALNALLDGQSSFEFILPNNEKISIGLGEYAPAHIINLDPPADFVPPLNASPTGEYKVYRSREDGNFYYNMQFAKVGEHGTSYTYTDDTSIGTPQDGGTLVFIKDGTAVNIQEVDNTPDTWWWDFSPDRSGIALYYAEALTTMCEQTAQHPDQPFSITDAIHVQIAQEQDYIDGGIERKDMFREWLGEQQNWLRTLNSKEQQELRENDPTAWLQQQQEWIDQQVKKFEELDKNSGDSDEIYGFITDARPYLEDQWWFHKAQSEYLAANGTLDNPEAWLEQQQRLYQNVIEDTKLDIRELKQGNKRLDEFRQEVEEWEQNPVKPTAPSQEPPSFNRPWDEVQASIQGLASIAYTGNFSQGENLVPSTADAAVLDPSKGNSIV